MATFINYRPVRDFVSLADTMRRWSDEDARQRYHYAGNGGTQNAPGRQIAYLPVDAYATENEFVISAELTGVNPDAVEITFEGDELTIRGEFRPAVEGVNYIMRERYAGPFERRLTFNVPVDADHIEAEFAHGVLTLTVPKAEAVRPKQIKVRTA